MRAAKLHIVLLDHQRILYVLRSASCLQLVHYLLQSTSANVVAGIASSAAPTISVRISIFEASFRHRHGAFLFANRPGRQVSHRKMVGVPAEADNGPAPESERLRGR